MHGCQMQAEQTLEVSPQQARNSSQDVPLKTTDTEKVSAVNELSPQHLAAMIGYSCALGPKVRTRQKHIKLSKT